ncbi:uncharacterized protein DUF2508 [Salsuginibacillus halophilus]|uniref:Uncharacterized protein DUF2508 n=1 Tax=Salsuginibacillus halophilus TaxID=517424 RepID=A0A2P8HIC6_9BACI|nr:YaaL family protein [Salsuginibacillus halophilus]PSL45968.1 uncharacterized protein DUF2508 [Salsuginibacillus halophilus]
MRLRKRKICEQENRRLIHHIERLKQELEQQRAYLEISVDPPLETVRQLQLSEAKYMLLLKEARHRGISRG